MGGLEVVILNASPFSPFFQLCGSTVRSYNHLNTDISLMFTYFLKSVLHCLPSPSCFISFSSGFNRTNS